VDTSATAGQGAGVVASLPTGYSRLADKPPMVPPPQKVAPQTVIEGRLKLKTAKERNRKVKISSRKGTTVWTASELTDHNMPVAALRAYKHAAAVMATEDPSCHLPWTLLAGIGRVESDHGQYGGSVLGSDGFARPAIIGIPLNGAGPVAAIHDTDNGVWDGDKVWDRAVGPMQFLPSTWAWAGRDGDGDGIKSPNDINDAALAAAGYLCHGISGSIVAPASMRAAIFHYNPSNYYVALVSAFARGYATGVFTIPSPPPPADPHKHHKHGKHGHKGAKHHGKQHAKDKAKNKKNKGKGTEQGSGNKPTKPTSPSPSNSPSTSPRPKPTPKPSPTPSPTPGPSQSPDPSPSPTPSPSKSPSSSPSKSPSKAPSKSPKPKPSPPATVSLSGTWTSCGTGWCVDGVSLDLGPATQLAATAAYDYDQDNTVEPNAAEFAGLVGQKVTLVVGKSSNPAVVYAINDQNYRLADGTYTG
jgi:hypothetical protein